MKKMERDRLLQWQRYEVKYLINEVQAAEIVRYCRDYMPPDPHTPSNGASGYPVLSIYLDSPTRTLLRQTLDKHARRFKLRVRRYQSIDEANYDGPVFFEVKRRMDGIMQKIRFAAPTEQSDWLLWNDILCAPPGWRASVDPESEFFLLRNRVQASPIVGVYYLRSAFESRSAERVRVTLDRNLTYGSLSPNGKGHTWWPARTDGVILEIKFTNTYPQWIAQAIRRLEIMRRGVCKYVICCQAAGISANGGSTARRLYE